MVLPLRWDGRVAGGGEGGFVCSEHTHRGTDTYLARQRRNRHPRALALQDLAEVFKVRVAAADDRVAQLEGGDVGARVDLVGGVHCAGRGAVGLRIFDLGWGLGFALVR